MRTNVYQLNDVRRIRRGPAGGVAFWCDCAAHNIRFFEGTRNPGIGSDRGLPKASVGAWINCRFVTGIVVLRIDASQNAGGQSVASALSGGGLAQTNGV